MTMPARAPRPLIAPAVAIAAGLLIGLLIAVSASAAVWQVVTRNEHRSCAGIEQLATRQPPAGDPTTNPSRGYLQGLHAAFVVIAQETGCSK